MTILYAIFGLLVFLFYMVIGKFIRLWLSEIFLEIGRKFINLDHAYKGCDGCKEGYRLIGTLGIRLFNFSLYWRAYSTLKILWPATAVIGLLQMLIGFLLRIFYYSLSYKREFFVA